MDKNKEPEHLVYCECGHRWIEKVSFLQPKVKPCGKCGELVYID